MPVLHFYLPKKIFLSKRKVQLSKEFADHLKSNSEKLSRLLIKNDNKDSIDNLTLMCVSFFSTHSESITTGCPWNYANIGDRLQNGINNYIENSFEEKIVILVIFYRFITEHIINVPEMEYSQRNHISRLLKRSIESFETNDSEFLSIRYHAIEIMPLTLLSIKNSAKTSAISLQLDAVKSTLDNHTQFTGDINAIRKTINNWDEQYNEKELRIQSLNKELKDLSSNYNFANLSHGFEGLLNSKKFSLHINTFLLIIFSLILITPPIYSIVKSLGSLESTINHSHDFISFFYDFFPFVALDFFILFFYRVSLNTRKEITTQIVQLELRRSLCQFIESYSEKSKELHASTPKLLEKFENLIFSGLTTESANVPTTFDGIEQISNLIKTLKSTP